MDFLMWIELINSNNFYATTPKLSEKFGNPFSHLCIFGDIFVDSATFLSKIDFIYFSKSKTWKTILSAEFRTYDSDLTQFDVM